MCSSFRWSQPGRPALPGSQVQECMGTGVDWAEALQALARRSALVLQHFNLSLLDKTTWNNHPFGKYHFMHVGLAVFMYHFYQTEFQHWHCKHFLYGMDVYASLAYTTTNWGSSAYTPVCVCVALCERIMCVCCVLCVCVHVTCVERSCTYALTWKLPK